MAKVVISKITYICDGCSVSEYTEGDTAFPQGWREFHEFDGEHGRGLLQFCPLCTNTALLHLFESKRLAEEQILPWSRLGYLNNDVAVAASWDNDKCPECKGGWSKGDPLGHSDSLGRWVHWECR